MFLFLKLFLVIIFTIFWYLPYLMTKKWVWSKFNKVWNTELNFSHEFLGYQVRYVLFSFLKKFEENLQKGSIYSHPWSNSAKNEKTRSFVCYFVKNFEPPYCYNILYRIHQSREHCQAFLWLVFGQPKP